MPARSRSSSSSRCSRRAPASSRSNAARRVQVLGAAVSVEDLELSRGQRQLAVLVLAVEGQQPRAEHPQLGRGHRAPVEVGARAPGRGDPAGQHRLAAVERQPVGQLGQLRVAGQRRPAA